MNKVILAGAIGSDAELKYAASGTAVCKFRLATNERQSNGEQKTSWHSCTMFGKFAEAFAKHLVRGKTVALEGTISYTELDGENGKRYFTDILVDNLEFTGSKQGQR